MSFLVLNCVPGSCIIYQTRACICYFLIMVVNFFFFIRWSLSPFGESRSALLACATPTQTQYLPQNPKSRRLLFCYWSLRLFSLRPWRLSLRLLPGLVFLFVPMSWKQAFCCVPIIFLSTCPMGRSTTLIT